MKIVLFPSVLEVLTNAGKSQANETKIEKLGKNNLLGKF